MVARHAHDSRYNVRSLITTLGCTEKELWRVFRRSSRYSPKRFLSHLRAVRVRTALARGISIKEATFEFGFANPSHLSRTLKQHLGTLPSELVTGENRRSRKGPVARTPRAAAGPGRR